MMASNYGSSLAHWSVSALNDDDSGDQCRLTLSSVLFSSAHPSLQPGWWAEVKSHRSPCLTTMPTEASQRPTRRTRTAIQRQWEEPQNLAFTLVKTLSDTQCTES